MPCVTLWYQETLRCLWFAAAKPYSSHMPHPVRGPRARHLPSKDLHTHVDGSVAILVLAAAAERQRDMEVLFTYK